MNGFLWASGHIGWGLFALAVFTALWVLLADVYWRIRSTRAARLATTMAVGWLIGAVVIVLVFYLGNR